MRLSSEYHMSSSGEDGGPSLTHLDADGSARMVDVTAKAVTSRSAAAGAGVKLGEEAMRLLVAGNHKKGDVLGVARIAGIQAAKRCSELIPLCHPLSLNHVDVAFTIREEEGVVDVKATCSLEGKTGVEMEALTAASVACLTIYDMCKAVDKGIVISGIQLLNKQGGKSGDWSR